MSDNLSLAKLKFLKGLSENTSVELRLLNIIDGGSEGLIYDTSYLKIPMFFLRNCLSQ